MLDGERPMDLPVSDPGPVRDAAPLHHCPHCDMEMVHKIAQLLLPGLATACVDATTGDLFKSYASVAVGLRSEMVDYLTERSQTHVAESILQHEDGPMNPPPAEEESSHDPTDVIGDFIEDFASSHRSVFARVSGWLLTDSRDDKIDDLVQEMEQNAFWIIDRREAVADVLIKNIDVKNEFHCDMKFDDEQQLEDHKKECGFRPEECANEGCMAKFRAAHAQRHNDACPFKVVPCEQGCGEILLRREMDRHCVTVCKMRMMHCPFFQVGCQSAFPHCKLKQHCEEFLRSHLQCVLKVIHKEDSPEDLERRAERLEKSQSQKLSGALEVRSMTWLIKQQEAKMNTEDATDKGIDSETKS